MDVGFVEYTLDQVRRGEYLNTAIIPATFVEQFVKDGYCKSKWRCYAEEVLENVDKKGGLSLMGEDISFYKMFLGNMIKYATGWNAYYAYVEDLIKVGLFVPTQDKPLPHRPSH